MKPSLRPFRCKLTNSDVNGWLALLTTVELPPP
jgi:hypothetical protein